MVPQPDLGGELEKRLKLQESQVPEGVAERLDELHLADTHIDRLERVLGGLEQVDESSVPEAVDSDFADEITRHAADIALNRGHISD